MTQTFLARKPLKIGYEIRQPGELVPEASTWYRVDSLVHSGFLVRVERSDEEILAALRKHKVDAEVAHQVVERDRKRDFPVDATPRPALGQPLGTEKVVYSTLGQAGESDSSSPEPEAPVAEAERAAEQAADAAAEGDAQGAVAAAQEAHRAADQDETGEADAYAEIADEAADEALDEAGYKLPRNELEKMSDEDLVDLAKSAGLRVRARDKVIDRLAE